MALIKCTECGKEISDKADVCPHCGKPLGQGAGEKTAFGKILFLVGSVIIAIAPLLTYSKECIFDDVSNYNMWGVVLKESRNGENDEIFAIIPTLIVILALVCVITAIVQIVKRKNIKFFIKGVCTGVTIVLFTVYETIGLREYKETISIMQNVMSDNGLGSIYAVSKGIGFYLLIIGIVVTIIALVIDKGKTA